MVDPNIKILLFLVKAPNVDVIIDFSVSLIFVSLSNEKIFNKEGSNKNVTNIEIINPKGKIVLKPLSMTSSPPHIYIGS